MILIVDDSDIVRNFVKKIFNDMYEVKLANDGKEALNYIASDTDNKIVGMLLDLNMPNVNGFQVLDYFDKNNLFSKIPVAIITGVDTKDEISKAFMYPIVDILNKPFNDATFPLISSTNLFILSTVPINFTHNIIKTVNKIEPRTYKITNKDSAILFIYPFFIHRID